MDSGGYNPSNSFIAPDFKRRQLLFDSFAKLQQKTSSDSASIPLTQPVLPSSNQSARPAQTATSTSSADSSTNQSNTQSDSLLVTDGAKGTLLYGWGAGYHGQLGLNTARKKCRLQPACIDFHEPSVMVACGGFHTAVLTDDGRVYTWGDGRLGQLGNLARKHNMHSTPRLVDYLVTYKVSISYIACGQYHTAALSNQGRLYTWGSGKWGQLGHGVRQDERFPRKVDTDRSIGNLVKVACGDRHTAVLNDAGAVITFGNGQHGQLGHGNGLDCLRPTIISSGDLSTQKVVALDCGATTTAAVTESGQLYLWGFGESLHPKGVSNVLEAPREVKLKGSVKAVACGLGHVLVLTNQGDVYSFGVAGMGQIGHGTKNSVRTPRCILKGKEIHQIAAGRYHSMAVSSYGIVYSWGCSESGQTGVNLNLENEYLPRIIDNLLANVVGHIACGEHHSLALTSISHSTINTDVQQWKLIEDSELELKRVWLKDNLNGLKTKHILAIEEARPAMIEALAQSIKHEREEKNKAARSKIALLTDVTNGNAQSRDQMNEAEYDEVQMETERDYTDGTLSAAAIRAIEATAARLANTGTFDVNQSTNRNDDDDEEEAAAKRRRTKRLAALMNSTDAQSSAQSTTVTPRGSQSINPSINPDVHEEKESMVVYQSPSHSRPASTIENRVRFPPLNRPLANQSTNQTTPAAGEIGFAPLAPRISFIESTTKTLVKVKSFMSNTVIPAEGNYVDELISVKKQYNALKSARLRLEKQQQTKAHELSLCAPNAEEVASARVQNDALKALNMKLVTLNTRLMEAEENKKNYELYIIRMKEEDLQLGKQIDHLRSICSEYSRLLNKLEKMNQRVAAQKLEVVDETHHLVDDVHKFISFADSVVNDYRRVLQASYRQSCYQEQLLNQRAARVDSKRQAKIEQLREEMRDLTQTHTQVKADIDEWENKVEYYERRFRKVAAATGLTRADEIISKFYFNDEITKDLTNEIASKQAQLDVLNQSMKQLSDELTASQESLSVSKWKDVSSAESRLAEAKLMHQRSQEEADKWTNRVTQCIQGMQQLYAQIKHVVPGEDIDQLIVNQPTNQSTRSTEEDEDEETDESNEDAEDVEATNENQPSGEDVSDLSANDEPSFNDTENDESLNASQTLDVVLPTTEDAEDSESEGEDVLDVTQLMNEVAIATAKRIAHLSQPRSESEAQPRNSTTHSTLDLTSPPRRPGTTSHHTTDPLQRATGLTAQSIDQLQAALRAGLSALVEAVEATKLEAAQYHRQRAAQEQQAYEQQTQAVREEQLAAMLINPRKNIWESLHDHVQQATVDEDELNRFNQTIEQSETASASIVDSRPATQSSV